MRLGTWRRSQHPAFAASWDGVDRSAGCTRAELGEIAALGDTRLSFLRKGALGAGAALSGGAILSALVPTTALAGGRPPGSFGAGDIGILNYALTLEYLESSFFNEATSAGKITDPALKQLLRTVTQDENAHVKLLKEAARSPRDQEAEVRLPGHSQPPGQSRRHDLRARKHRRARISRSGPEHPVRQGPAHGGVDRHRRGPALRRDRPVARQGHCPERPV